MNQDPPDSKPPVLVLCRDLLFVSRITSTARAVNVPVKIMRDPGQLDNVDSGALIVDLDQDGVLDAGCQWKQRTGGNLIGFVSHVHTETISRARESGFDSVLPRGAFSAHLEQILRDAAGSS